jgi:hypothetical protein
MSTRSNTIIKLGRTKLIFYKHHDGYPSGVGKDLFNKLCLCNSNLSDEKTIDIEEFIQSMFCNFDLVEEISSDINYLYILNFDEYFNCQKEDKYKINYITIDQDHKYGKGGSDSFYSLDEFNEFIMKYEVA